MRTHQEIPFSGEFPGAQEFASTGEITQNTQNIKHEQIQLIDWESFGLLDKILIKNIPMAGKQPPSGFNRKKNGSKKVYDVDVEGSKTKNT